jgi:hypothetical protein
MRLWRIVEILSSNPQGVLVEQVASRLRVARATCYRDFGTLKAAGVNVTSKQVGVSRRYFLPEGHASPLPKPTPRQILALRLARSLLIPFEGLEILSELDELLKPSTEASTWERAWLEEGGPRVARLSGKTDASVEGLSNSSSSLSISRPSKGIRSDRASLRARIWRGVGFGSGEACPSGRKYLRLTPTCLLVTFTPAALRVPKSR